MNIRRLVALCAFFAVLGSSAAEAASLSYTASGQTINYTVAWKQGMTVEQAMQSIGPDYVTTWSQKYQGNALLMVLGVDKKFPTTPVSTNGKLGKTYWLLCVDGKPANTGMSQQTIPEETSKIQWYWASQYVCK